MNNGQSAAKPLLNEEGSEIIPVKGSRLEVFLSETPNIVIEELSSKKLNKSSCIYCIFSISRMLPYIGSTKNYHKRILSHKLSLRKNIHRNKYLQGAYNKSTINDFYVFVVEYCNVDNLSEKEIYWINYFDSKNRRI